MKALHENITLQNDGELEYSSDDLVYLPIVLMDQFHNGDVMLV